MDEMVNISLPADTVELLKIYATKHNTTVAQAISNWILSESNLNGDIKLIRARAGLSQSEFSIKTGIPIGTLRNWEQGSRKAPGYIINLIEKSLKYDELKSKESE